MHAFVLVPTGNITAAELEPCMKENPGVLLHVAYKLAQLMGTPPVAGLVLGPDELANEEEQHHHVRLDSKDTLLQY